MPFQLDLRCCVSGVPMSVWLHVEPHSSLRCGAGSPRGKLGRGHALPATPRQHPVNPPLQQPWLPRPSARPGWDVLTRKRPSWQPFLVGTFIIPCHIWGHGGTRMTNSESLGPPTVPETKNQALALAVCRRLCALCGQRHCL